MSSSINLSLTDELRAFIDANSGDGTLYATPSEFVRDLLRQQKSRQEAAAARDAILEGYQDAVEGRTHAYKGDLSRLTEEGQVVAKRTRRKPTVHLTNRALRDIADIEAYSVEQFGKDAADRYLSALEAGISRIAAQPDLLRVEESFHETLRFYRIEKHLLACETGVAGKIIILTVLHASMDIPSRLAELEPSLVLEAELLVERLRT